MMLHLLMTRLLQLPHKHKLMKALPRGLLLELELQERVLDQCRLRLLRRPLRRRALQLSPTPSLAFVAVWACWLLVCGVLLSVM